MVRVVGDAPGVGTQHLSGTTEAQDFRKQLDTLHTVAANGTWNEVRTELGNLEGMLRDLSRQVDVGGTQQDRLNQLGAEDFNRLIDVLDETSTRAAQGHEWSVLEVIISILTLSIYYFARTGDDHKLVDKAEALQSKAVLWHVHSAYFEMREGGDVFSPKGSKEVLDEAQAKELIARFLLRQQEVLRDGQGGVSGVIDKSGVKLRGPDGKRLSINDTNLAQAKMEDAFRAVGGHLGVDLSLLDDGVITREGIDTMARSIVDGLQNDYGVKLKNLAGTYGGELKLTKTSEGIEVEQLRSRPGRRQELQFDRINDPVPNTNPTVTFKAVVTELTNDKTTPERFSELNDTLYKAFVHDREHHNVSPTLSFQQYKLQFIPFVVEGVDKVDLRWHDGGSDVNGAELAFLLQRVEDLPKNHTLYKYKVDVTVTDGLGQKHTVEHDFYSHRKLSKKQIGGAAREDVQRRFGFTKLTTANPQALGQTDIKRDEMVEGLTKFSPAQMKALLSDSKGHVLDPNTGKPMRVEDDLSGARELTARVIKNNVMGATLGTAAQNLSIGLGRLLKPGIPDTQRIFVRQSNGSDNSDYFRNVPIGQAGIVRGAQDTGAFGKCAPLSEFCGTMTTVGRGARDALEALKGDNRKNVSDLGQEIEDAFHAPVFDAQARKVLQEKLDALGDLAKADPSLVNLHRDLVQLKVSVVDRLQFESDDDGPYLKMKFYMSPTLWQRDGYGLGVQKKSGMVEVKVRPQHIQEYLEATLRDDNYRGGMRHMMDFYKDPNAMNFGELFRELGVGLIAVGVDRALKESGKRSGLLFGPGHELVSSMVLNREVTGRYTGVDGSAGTLGKMIIGDGPHLEAALDEVPKFEKTHGPLSVANKAEYLKLFDTIKQAAKDDRNEVLDKIENDAKGPPQNDDLLKVVQDLRNEFTKPASRGRDNTVRALGKNLRSLVGWDDEDMKSMCEILNAEASLHWLQVSINNGPQDAKANRDRMLGQLKEARDNGGSITVSMGFNGNNGHVNYVQAWGTPFIGGVAIDSKDLARCHMNGQENAGMTSAWFADRNSYEMLDLSRMQVGIDGLKAKLVGTGNDTIIQQLDELWQRIDDVENAFDDGMDKATKAKNPDEAKAEVRSAHRREVHLLSRAMYDLLQEHLVIDNHDGKLDTDNVVLMSSNTERDNRVHDSENDRQRVGRGNIGSQKEGTTNALDGSYFVPLSIMSSGWNSISPQHVNGYRDADPKDHYAILRSLSVTVGNGPIHVK